MRAIYTRKLQTSYKDFYGKWNYFPVFTYGMTGKAENVKGTDFFRFFADGISEDLYHILHKSELNFPEY